MVFNRYVLFLIIAALLSLTSVTLVFTQINPFEDEKLSLLLLFLSLFFSISSFMSLIGYTIRLLFYRDELFLNHFNVSLRQGLVLGLCVCALMGLQILRTLTWWNAILIVLITFLMEVYFVARE